MTTVLVVAGVLLWLRVGVAASRHWWAAAWDEVEDADADRARFDAIMTANHEATMAQWREKCAANPGKTYHPPMPPLLLGLAPFATPRLSVAAWVVPLGPLYWTIPWALGVAVSARDAGRRYVTGDDL